MTRLLCLMLTIAACTDDPTNGLPQPPTNGEPGVIDVWSGTAERRLDSTFDGFSSSIVTQADVEWRFDDAFNYHVPSGTVRYTENTTYDNSPNAPCVITASYTGPLDPNSSSLFLDAASYVGAGIELNAVVTVVDSCNGTTTAPTQLLWFGPSAMGAIDGDRIDFEASTPAGEASTLTAKYHFETSP